MRYAKGEWSVCKGRDKNNNPTCNIETKGFKNNGFEVAKLRGPDMVDNARLIAASPDLLIALQALLIVADHPDNPMRTGPNASIIADARQAIAKATGQGGVV